MDEMYELLKQKLKTMRDEQDDAISFDYFEVAKLYQMLCLLKQVREIVDWGDKGYA